MKRSGDEKSAKLCEECDEFLDLYNLYGRVTIPPL